MTTLWCVLSNLTRKVWITFPFKPLMSVIVIPPLEVGRESLEPENNHIYMCTAWWCDDDGFETRKVRPKLQSSQTNTNGILLPDLLVYLEVKWWMSLTICLNFMNIYWNMIQGVQTDAWTCIHYLDSLNKSDLLTFCPSSNLLCSLSWINLNF